MCAWYNGLKDRREPLKGEAKHSLQVSHGRFQDNRVLHAEVCRENCVGVEQLALFLYRWYPPSAQAIALRPLCCEAGLNQQPVGPSSVLVVLHRSRIQGSPLASFFGLAFLRGWLLWVVGLSKTQFSPTEHDFLCLGVAWCGWRWHQSGWENCFTVAWWEAELGDVQSSRAVRSRPRHGFRMNPGKTKSNLEAEQKTLAPLQLENL